MLLSLSHSNAQTLDYVTGNLINFSGSPTTTTSNWNNAGSFGQPLTCWKGGDPGYCGPQPLVNGNGFGSINFSYGLTDLNQVINVANSVTAATGPVKVTGFNFSFNAKNGNGWDDGRIDQLSAYVKLYSPTHALLENYSYNLTSKYDWTNFSYNQTFTAPHPLSTVGTAQVGFVGKDNNFWAGPYGPEIMNVNFTLKYSVNPCVTNPGYMPSCPGFNNVITSSNLVPHPGAATSWGGTINNSFAIQTALQNSGSGLIVHGFDYGYVVNATQSYCEAQFIICWSWHSGGSVQVNTSITGAKGQTIYSASRNYNETGYSAENLHYRFPMSTNQMLLGNFNFTASTSGDSYVGNMYARMVYSQDPCVNNPNYSPSCINKVAPTYTAPSVAGTSTSKELASTGATVINAGGAQVSATGTISAPDNIPQTVKDTQTNTQQSSQAIGVTSTQQSTKSTPNASVIANAINQVQANEKSMQAAAVLNASKALAASVAKSQEQVTTTITMLNSMSAASVQSSQEAVPTQTPVVMSTQTTAPPLQVPTPPTLQTLMSTTRVSSEVSTQPNITASVQTTINTQAANELPAQQIYQPQSVNVFEVSSAQVSVSQQQTTNTTSQFLLYIPPAKMYASPTVDSQQTISVYLPPPPVIEESTPIFSKVESKFSDTDVSVAPTTSLTKNSMVAEVVDAKTSLDVVQNEQSTDTVKKNIQTNDLAGGVDIASIATQPKGYDVYSQLTLKDAAFYKVEDIYKNQKTIDNLKLLRGLRGGSDRLHQEMVDQQYQLGK